MLAAAASLSTETEAIVITTKQGSSEKPKVEIISNLSVLGKPNLHNVDQMSSSDRIELDKYLFKNGRYDAAINPVTAVNKSTAIPEAVELLIENPSDLESKLTALSNQNLLDDLSKYFYKTSTRQQYNLNISGRQEKMQYYMSGGFNNYLSNLIGERHNKVSIRSSNTYFVNDRLSFDASVNLFYVKDLAGNNKGINTGASSLYSLPAYTRLANDDGRPLPVYIPLRKGFVDSMNHDGFLDWNYSPIDDVDNELHSQKLTDYMVNVGTKYKIIEGLNFIMKYQYQNQVQQNESLLREQSYFARNMINDYVEVNPTTNVVTYRFPRGGVLYRDNITTTSHQGRLQFDFNKTFEEKHSIIALGGFEIRKLSTLTDNFHNIGYDEKTGGIVNVYNPEEYYQTNSSGSYLRIMVTDYRNEFKDNFYSFYSNFSYTYDKRYIFSGSIRKDNANLFGLMPNQKGTPLWSVGGAWQLDNESFYNLDWLPSLKLSATYGVNGNIARKANAITTISTSTGGSTHSLPTAYLLSLPNEKLSWERVKQFNVGVDFGTKNNRLYGTIEYYNKTATDLLAESPIDPTYGVSSMFLNVADMVGKGVDIHLNTSNLIGNITWQSSLIYSHSISKVTDYLMPIATTGSTYLPISLANPLVGRPLYSVFALAWDGLDSETGDPVGVVNGEKSKDYNFIYNGTPLEQLVFKGTAQPTHFGALMNTFKYKNFDLSFNISFKLGYYFRRNSVDYSAIYSRDWRGHSDYSLRWKESGDELLTDVPSRIYPAIQDRDSFYKYSEALVEKADNIRFEDLNFGYSFEPKNGIKNVRIFIYSSNLGVLWKANKHGIDPYYQNVPLPGFNFSFGTNLTF